MFLSQLDGCTENASESKSHFCSSLMGTAKFVWAKQVVSEMQTDRYWVCFPQSENIKTHIRAKIPAVLSSFHQTAAGPQFDISKVLSRSSSLKFAS